MPMVNKHEVIYLINKVAFFKKNKLNKTLKAKDLYDMSRILY